MLDDSNDIEHRNHTMAWASLTCITLALILSILVQFTNSWQTSEYDGVSYGLDSVAIDCSDPQWLWGCDDEVHAILFTDDWDDLEGEEFDMSEKKYLRGPHDNYCVNYIRMMLNWELAWGGSNSNENLEAAEHWEEKCLNSNKAGETGGIVIWMGAISALFGTTFILISNIDKTLPANAERYGHFIAWVSGGFILLGCLTWVLMRPEPPIGYDFGMSFYMAIIAGVLAICAGFLSMFGKNKIPNED